MRHDPVSSVLKIAGQCVSVPLLEQADGFILHKKANIRRQHTQIGVRHQIIHKIRHVIPDEKLWRNPPPSLDVIAHFSVDFAVRRIRYQWYQVRTFDRAEPHNHIPPRLDCLWRLASVLVRQRVNPDVRKLFLYVLRHFVDEGDHRRRRRPFRLVQRPALLARAVTVPVILADGDNTNLRIFPQLFQNTLGEEFAHFVIRQAKLRSRIVPLFRFQGVEKLFPIA